MVETDPAVGFRDGCAEEPELLQALDDCSRVLIAVIELTGDRRDLDVDELAHGLDDQLLIFTEVQEHRYSPRLGWRGPEV